MMSDANENEAGLTRWYADDYPSGDSTPVYPCADVDPLLAAKDKRIAELERLLRNAQASLRAMGWPNSDPPVTRRELAHVLESLVDGEWLDQCLQRLERGEDARGESSIFAKMSPDELKSAATELRMASGELNAKVERIRRGAS